MSILVTRPEPGASRTVAALAAMGKTALAAPLFEIVLTAQPRPSGRFAALLVTSQNGAAGLSPASSGLAADLPVFAVGDRTAQALRDAGFTDVTSASGDQKALTRLVLARLSTRYRVLLATGEDHKDGLPTAFAAAGHELAVWLRYKAEAVAKLPDEAREALRAGQIDVALHYSRRASETLLSLAAAEGLGDALARMRHLCLSQDVAAPLQDVGLAKVEIAAHPDEDSLLALVDAGPKDALPSMDAGVHAVSEADPPGMTMTTTPESAPPASPAEEMNAPEGRSRTASSRARRQATAQGSSSEQPAEPALDGPASRLTDTASRYAGQAVAGARAEMTASTAGTTDDTATGPAASTAPTPERADAPASTTLASAMSSPELSAAPSTVPQRGGAGILGLMAAGLVGGLVGAGTMAYLPQVSRLAGMPLPAAVATGELEARLARIEAQPRAETARPAGAEGVSAGQVQALVQGQIQAASAPLRGEIEAVQRRVTELAQRPAAPAGDASASQSRQLAELADRLARTERGSETAVNAVRALVPRLAELEQIGKTVGTPSAPATGAARLILADRLGKALTEGRPFAVEARALAATGASAEPMQVLNGLAAGGAPSGAGLLADFRKLRAVLAVEPANVDAPWTERLLKLTDGLVRVRSTGAVEGSSPAAITARIEQALQRGDAAAARAAWAQLPEPARRASEAFGAALKQRADADQAIKAITDDAIKALSAAT
jgi:uroporphyrinogen-III synthase